jgi:hypothetical protein
MATSKKTVRGLIALGLAVGLVVAACGSKAPANLPVVNAGGTGSLSSGLSGNLATLDSYKFSWSYSTAASGATAADTGSLTTSGIVINKPTKAYKINNMGIVQVIVIGDQGWMSTDNGSTWKVDTTYTSGSSSLESLLPDSLYGSNFDVNAADFSMAGSDNKNGIDCVHYSGNTSLGALGGMAGVMAGANDTFKADLWVSKSGNFPVSGFYGWTVTANGASESWGYQFDVTNVNDSSNKVEAPTNVTALSSL